MNELTINEWRNAVFDSELNTSAKIVGLAIARYWRPDKLCYPSILTLTTDCSLSKPSVIAAIKALKNAGLIKIKKGELKYLTSLQNFYELVGVDNGKDNGKDDSKDNGKSNGKGNGKTNGKGNGKIILPEIREVSEVREIREDNTHTSSDKSSDVCGARVSKINEILEKHGLSKIRELTSQRQQKLRDRIKSAGTLENFLQELDTALAGSAFLRGEAKSDWKADFDFFLSPQKWQKVVEGAYADKKEVKHFDWEDVDFKEWDKW